MKKYSKLIVAAIVALIFIGTFVFLYEKSQPKPVEYTEFTPKMADVLKTTVITGKIEPRNEVSVKPQISGIITEICKEAGDYVQAGEVIAKVKVIPDIDVYKRQAQRFPCHLREDESGILSKLLAGSAGPLPQGF